MKNKVQLDGMPVWFDGKSINEALFCEEFLQTHKIIFTNGAFFTPECRVIDELPLRGEIFEELKYCAVSNIPRKISNIVELMKLAALVEDFPPEPDRIHLSNGTLFLDGTFAEGKPKIVRNRFPVAYNPNAPKPVLWLQFLDGLLYPEDIPTLQEYIGYCLIPSNKGQRMMVIKGSGGEGKSQIGAVLGTLFGSNMKDGSIGKISENRFARADLEHILLTLYRKTAGGEAEPVTTDADNKDVGQPTWSGTNSDKWTYSYEGHWFPETDEDGNTYTYWVVEDIPEGSDYGVSYVDKDGNLLAEGEAGMHLRNELEKPIDITVNKVWLDDDSSERPTEITLTLKADDKEVTEGTITLPKSADSQNLLEKLIALFADDADSGDDKEAWTFTWSDLPKYDEDGKRIDYTVEESGKGLDNYLTTVKQEETGDGYTFTVTNTAKIDIPVEKIWNGIPEDQQKEVVIGLYRSTDSQAEEAVKDGDGAGEPLTVALNESNNWKGTFVGLPMYDAETRKPYDYSIQEETVDGQPADSQFEITYDEKNGTLTVTNAEKPYVPPVITSTPKPSVTPTGTPEDPDETPSVTPTETPGPDETPSVTPTGTPEDPDETPSVTPTGTPEDPDETPSATPTGTPEDPDETPSVTPTGKPENPTETPASTPAADVTKPPKNPSGGSGSGGQSGTDQKDPAKTGDTAQTASWAALLAIAGGCGGMLALMKYGRKKKEER